MKRNQPFRAFQKVKTLKPARSLFDLSHELLATYQMFKLYPCCYMEMSPGDTFHIANQSVTRLQPLNAPVLSEITQSTHYFFVPYRLLDPNWVEFISGNFDGESGGNNRTDYKIVDGKKQLVTPSEVSPSLPRWIPSEGKNGVGSLWDYFGLPVDVDPNGAYPLAYLKRAYNLVWNEFYRDENHQEEVDLDNEDILYRSWKKDYFTSALLSQQRGIAPAMPVTGEVNLGSATENGIQLQNVSPDPYSERAVVVSVTLPTGLDSTKIIFAPANISYTIRYEDSQDNADIIERLLQTQISLLSYNPLTGSAQLVLTASATFISQLPSQSTFLLVPFVSGTVNFSSIPRNLSLEGAGFDVKDLRQAFQIQKWLELANRGGVRYTEFLRSFFGVSPRDDRLQRPEYIGGSKSPIVVSEVLQTSATTNEPTPQGYMAGHGLGAERTYIGSYSASEYGILLGLISYTTPPLYQQGINRQWLRNTKYDFLFPQFTHLSEQAISGAEIYATDDASENQKVWGFNEVYDELRSIPSLILGKMRTTFDYWHLGRKFNSKPALNEDFISGKDVSKRIFAVQNEDGIICNYANIIRAVRPLPKYGNPGGI